MALMVQAFTDKRPVAAVDVDRAEAHNYEPPNTPPRRSFLWLAVAFIVSFFRGSARAAD